MLLNELTPAQVSTLLEAECTDAELTEAMAAVRQFSEAVVECLRRSAGQSIAELAICFNVLALPLQSLAECPAKVAHRGMIGVSGVLKNGDGGTHLLFRLDVFA